MPLDKTFGVQASMTIPQKLRHMNWGLLLLLTVIAAVGWLSLYSAAGGDIERWALKQMVRFGAGVCILIVVAMIDIRWWYRLAYPIYGVTLVLLLIVDVMGHVGMGAQRWINLGFIQIQPSEIMKLAAVMALARYFHGASAEEMRRLFFLIPPAIMIAVPVALVMWQPDLGTSLMITMGGIGVIFLAGAPLWIFIGGGAAVLAILPIAWGLMHDYQKRRVTTFLNPESDPLGAGYHITQSKIALGSGGVGGKGFMNGTQTHLNFLPEKQTDFIFTLWAEEWGLMGGLFLLVLFGLVFLYAGWIAFRCRHGFGRLLAFGLMINFSIYAFVNVAMVMGMIPVVGIPLPLVSYGGTAMLSILTSFGLIMCCGIHRDTKLPRM